MSFNMTVWEVEGNNLKVIAKTKLDNESRLEDWVSRDSSILGLDILIIGRQVTTYFGGRIDLLAIDSQGDIVILELKRDKTPRNIVAQVLDYASWIDGLTPKDIDEIATAYLKENLTTAFNSHFGTALPEVINSNHSMVIIASELDESSERIVQYLATRHNLNINAIYFNFFKNDRMELLGRSWLMDPEELIERSDAMTKAPWSGYWFVNVGEGPHRNWDDCREYGFISAGQGTLYSGALKKLKVGDKIFAYMKSTGYVGYGEVNREAVMVKDFTVAKNGRKLLELDLKQPNLRENAENPDLSEWVVGIQWSKIVKREEAKTFAGVFANQNIVCKLRHQPTLDFLKKEFNVNETE